MKNNMYCNGSLVLFFMLAMTACSNPKAPPRPVAPDKNLSYAAQSFNYPDGAKCTQAYQQYNPPYPQYLSCFCDGNSDFYRDPIDLTNSTDISCISKETWVARNERRQQARNKEAAEKLLKDKAEKAKADAEKARRVNQQAADARELQLTRKFCTGTPRLDRTVTEILSTHWGVHPGSISLNRVSLNSEGCSGAFYTPVGVRYCSGLKFNNDGSVRYSLMICPK